MSARWNYVDVSCVTCQVFGKIRIDQYNRKNKTWECRSCARKGKKITVKNPSAKHDPQKSGAYKSYWRAKRRTQINHKGVYKDILFLFNCFEEFWDELGPRPEGYTLERINVKSHYMPGNVKWACMSEQCRNKTNNVYVEYQGELICLYDAAKLSGIDPGAIKTRMRTGCPKEMLFKKGRWHVKAQQFFPATA